MISLIEGKARERRTHRSVHESKARCPAGGHPMWTRRCWSPLPRRGCSRRRRWRTRGLLRGRLSHDLRSVRSSPSSPSMSTGWDTPRTSLCAGSSMSGAWSYSTSIRLGCCTSPASSPSVRPSSGWSRMWTSFDGSSLGEPCRRGSWLGPRRLVALPCRRS